MSAGKAMIASGMASGPSELRRMLATTLIHLETIGGLDLLLLKDDNIRLFWGDLAKERADILAKEAILKKVRDMFSDEEIEMMGRTIDAASMSGVDFSSLFKNE